MFTRWFCSLVLAACVSLLLSSSARAQYKLETCEDLKIAEAHFGINTVETATCVNPTKTFSPKGTLRNVNVVYSFPKVPTGAGVTFIGFDFFAQSLARTPADARMRAEIHFVKDQQQPEGVAVGGDRVRADPLLVDQTAGEERLERRRERGHRRSPAVCLPFRSTSEYLKMPG